MEGTGRDDQATERRFLWGNRRQSSEQTATTSHDSNLPPTAGFRRGISKRDPRRAQPTGPRTRPNVPWGPYPNAHHYKADTAPTTELRDHQIGVLVRRRDYLRDRQPKGRSDERPGSRRARPRRCHSGCDNLVWSGGRPGVRLNPRFARSRIGAYASLRRWTGAESLCPAWVGVFKK